jgi:hypothetical protein
VNSAIKNTSDILTINSFINKKAFIFQPSINWNENMKKLNKNTKKSLSRSMGTRMRNARIKQKRAY